MAPSRAAFQASAREPAVSGAATVRSVAPDSRQARRQVYTTLGNCSSTTTTVCPGASGVLRAIVAIAYETDGMIATRSGSGAPMICAKSRRTRALGSKKSVIPRRVGASMRSSALRPAAATRFDAGAMNAQFR